METSQYEMMYQNIVADSSALSDEWLEQGGAGLLIADRWEQFEAQSKLHAHFLPTSNLTKFKKAMIEEGLFASMDLGIEPYSLGLWESCLFKSEVSASVMQECASKSVKLFRLSSLALAMTGSSDEQEISWLLASASQLFRDYEGVVDPATLAALLSFELPLGSHLFQSLAKIQSFKDLYKKLLKEKFQIETEAKVYCLPNPALLSRREPWTNLLRLTSVHSASLMGGAAGVVALPFDLFNHKPDARLTRNITEILRQESFLDKVDNPMAGSEAFESRLKALSKSAWQLFEEIENKDGLKHCLRSGWLHQELEPEIARKKAAVSELQYHLTGVNQYPLVQALDPHYPLCKQSETHDLEQWWTGFRGEQVADKLCDVEKFVPLSLTSIFENWQFRADDLRQRNNDWVRLQVHVENQEMMSKKKRIVEQSLALGGLLPHWNQDEPVGGPVHLVVAGDPDGDFSQNCLSALKDKGAKCVVWVGEKTLSGFDKSLGQKTELNGFFSTLFSHLEGRS